MTDHQSSDARSPLSSTRPEAGLEGHAPALKLDASVYRHFLDDTDWTEAQKDEFTQALWQIIDGVITLKFGIHPIQLVMESPKVLDVDSLSMLIFEEHLEIKELHDAANSIEGTVGREDS